MAYLGAWIMWSESLHMDLDYLVTQCLDRVLFPAHFNDIVM